MHVANFHCKYNIYLIAVLNLCHAEGRGVFRTLSNIYDETFYENSYQPLVVNYFR